MKKVMRLKKMSESEIIEIGGVLVERKKVWELMSLMIDEIDEVMEKGVWVKWKSFEEVREEDGIRYRIDWSDRLRRWLEEECDYREFVELLMRKLKVIRKDMGKMIKILDLSEVK